MTTQRDDTTTGTADDADQAGPEARDAEAPGRRRFRYTLPGAWVALVFACLAFTPSLLPAAPCCRGWCAASAPPSATGSG
jgi:uncharacterized membrane protein